METFTSLKAFADNPHFREQRQKSLAGLGKAKIDAPIIKHVQRLNRLPYCFTLQSCHGHFRHDGRPLPKGFKSLPAGRTIDEVEYRIAYIALCIDHSSKAMALFDGLRRVADIDRRNIQFCCAEWFWERQINSYALQVMPDRHKHLDKAMLTAIEASKIESVRDDFYVELMKMLKTM